MGTFNLSELYESVADVVPDRIAVVSPSTATSSPSPPTVKVGSVHS
jgi:hypothetical protein